MNLVSRASAAAFVLFSIACANEPAPPPPATAPPAPVSTVAAAPPAATGDLSVADGDFGVPECDRFLRNYYACLDTKVPAEGRPMLKQSLDMMKAGWKQAAATPQGKAGLATSCTQAEAQAKMSMAAYNCTW